MHTLTLIDIVVQKSVRLTQHVDVLERITDVKIKTKSTIAKIPFVHNLCFISASLNNDLNDYKIIVSWQG